MEKTGFFEEQPGRRSNIRLSSFIVLCVAILIMAGHEYKHIKTLTDEAYSNQYCYFIFGLLGFAFFPKVMQKGIEAVLQWKLGQTSTSTEENTKTTT